MRRIEKNGSNLSDVWLMAEWFMGWDDHEFHVIQFEMTCPSHHFLGTVSSLIPNLNATHVVRSPFSPRLTRFSPGLLEAPPRRVFLMGARPLIGGASALARPLRTRTTFVLDFLPGSRQFFPPGNGTTSYQPYGLRTTLFLITLDWPNFAWVFLGLWLAWSALGQFVVLLCCTCGHALLHDRPCAKFTDKHGKQKNGRRLI